MALLLEMGDGVDVNAAEKVGVGIEGELRRQLMLLLLLLLRSRPRMLSRILFLLNTFPHHI